MSWDFFYIYLSNISSKNMICLEVGFIGFLRKFIYFTRKNTISTNGFKPFSKATYTRKEIDKIKLIL